VRRDVSLNNPGIYEIKSFFELHVSDWTRVFETNMMSGVRLARPYRRGMVERKFGRITFIFQRIPLMTRPK
jgi:short-subunit dehydrogenase